MELEKERHHIEILNLDLNVITGETFVDCEERVSIVSVVRGIVPLCKGLHYANIEITVIGSGYWANKVWPLLDSNCFCLCSILLLVITPPFSYGNYPTPIITHILMVFFFLFLTYFT